MYSPMVYSYANYVQLIINYLKTLFMESSNFETFIKCLQKQPMSLTNQLYLNPRKRRQPRTFDECHPNFSLHSPHLMNLLVYAIWTSTETNFPCIGTFKYYQQSSSGRCFCPEDEGRAALPTERMSRSLTSLELSAVLLITGISVSESGVQSPLRYFTPLLSAPNSPSLSSSDRRREVFRMSRPISRSSSTLARGRWGVSSSGTLERLIRGSVAPCSS